MITFCGCLRSCSNTINMVSWSFVSLGKILFLRIWFYLKKKCLLGMKNKGKIIHVRCYTRERVFVPKVPSFTSSIENQKKISLQKNHRTYVICMVVSCVVFATKQVFFFCLLCNQIVFYQIRSQVDSFCLLFFTFYWQSNRGRGI